MEEYGWDDGQKDPLGNFYADWPSLSDKARQVVIDNASHIANSGISLTQCDHISPIWYHLFKDAGIDVEIKGGNYSVQKDDAYPSLSDHTWLIVEGNLFDPTASQFGNMQVPIREDYYQESVSSAKEWFEDCDPDDWKLEKRLQEQDEYAKIKLSDESDLNPSIENNKEKIEDFEFEN